MSMSQPGSNESMSEQPARDATPRRLIVTAGVVIFAIRDWSLWVLLREGPWGPPMRLVLGSESVTDAVDRILEAVFVWHARATVFQLKSCWPKQLIYVLGISEPRSSLSLN